MGEKTEDREMPSIGRMTAPSAWTRLAQSPLTTTCRLSEKGVLQKKPKSSWLSSTIRPILVTEPEMNLGLLWCRRDRWEKRALKEGNRLGVKKGWGTEVGLASGEETEVRLASGMGGD